MTGQQNEQSATGWTAELWAGRSSSSHCFRLFLERNVTEELQQSEKNTTEYNSCDLTAAPPSEKLGGRVKYKKNRMIFCTQKARYYYT